ncbi:glycosyltransferase [Aromatoleum toluclasticum]|uniref:glycosyltransferase n=1 Tax=Aromatoleum toluclasticum TaxID=92003 RepID=UPI0003A0BCDC|nr:glycosyltransferase [Aromatoleum toluclasticum]
MRIVIDMQGAQTESRFRGIGRYSMSLALAIARNRNDHEVILALSGLFPDTIERIRAVFDSVLPQENIRVWHAPGPVREMESNNTRRRAAAELIREAFLASLRPDVIHVTSLFEGYIDDAVTSVGRFDQSTLVSVSLYDLIPLLNPDHYLRPNPTYEKFYFRKLKDLARADAWLAISDFSRREALEYLDVPSFDAVNIGTAVDDCFKSLGIVNEDAKFVEKKNGISRPFVLYAGGSDERKNLPRLIQAYACLPRILRKSYQLVLAGKFSEGDISILLSHASVAGLDDDELRFTGYITDQELIGLYNHCELFVFPSWHEGFGLPALEAMACGAAVIGANTSSLPEVIGREDALFDPYDVMSIAGKMEQALSDEAFRRDLEAHSLAQAKRFSWDSSARRAIVAFERLYERTRNVVPQKLKQREIVSRLVRAIACGNDATNLSDADCVSISAAIARNHPDPERRRRIYVDVSELVRRDARTGIQRVTRAILWELLSNPPAGYVVQAVYSTVGSGTYRQANTFTRGFFGDVLIDEPDSVLEPQSGDIFIGLDLQPQIVPECRDYYQSLRHQGVQVFFVVYDLLPISHPSSFPVGASESHLHWLEVVTEADGVVCISKAVADDLRNWMNSKLKLCSRPFALRWFHLGADIRNSAPTQGLPPEADKVLEVIRSRPTFLMVGTVEPRKGHAQALAAFQSLWAQGNDLGLVIVGKRGWAVDLLVASLEAHAQRGKRLFWLEGISDEYLEKIYSVATCLLMASEGEGFGLPLIEAAQHGLPIVARDLPVFREIAGENAFYFNGTAPDALRSAIAEWLSAHDEGRAPSSARIQSLTWAESAQQLIAAILGDEERLGNRGTDDERVIAAKRSRMGGDRRPGVLLLSPYPIRRPRHGGQLRTDAVRKAFEEVGNKVRVVGFYQSEAYSREDLGPFDIEFPPDSRFRLYRGKVLPALSDFLMADFAVSDEEIFRRVANCVDVDVDVIVVEQPWFYPLAKRLKREVPRCRNSVVVFSSQNIEAPMKQQILESATDSELARLAIADISALERAAAQESDLSVAVTNEDAEVLRGYGAANVIVARNGISPWVASSERREAWRAKLPSRPWPLFIASAHPPNFTGFIDSLGDALACIPPGSKLVVVGGVGPCLMQEFSKSRWRDLNLSRLLVLGVLDDADLSAVKSLAHAFLLPIGAGGGSNIKTAEALYSGKQVICTSVALRGFDAYRSMPSVWVADTPREFQAAIRTVLGVSGRTEREIETDDTLRRQLLWDVSLRVLPEEVSRILGIQGGAQ